MLPTIIQLVLPWSEDKKKTSRFNVFGIFSLHIVGHTQKACVIEVRCAEKAERCDLSSKARQQYLKFRNETASVQVSSRRTVMLASATVMESWR